MHCLKLDDTLFCAMGIRAMPKSEICVICLDMETVIELFLSYAFTFCRRSVKLKVLCIESIQVSILSVKEERGMTREQTRLISTIYLKD